MLDILLYILRIWRFIRLSEIHFVEPTEYANIFPSGTLTYFFVFTTESRLT